MAGSPRERLRNIMMANQHRTRAPELLQIDLLQLVAELLIEVKDELREVRRTQEAPARSAPAAPPPAPPQPVRRPEQAVAAAAFGL